MNVDEVRELLRRECEQAGTLAAWARRHDIAPQYVSDVINGRRLPGKRILDVLNLRKVTYYWPIEK